MQSVIAVFFGAGLGGVARYGIGRASLVWFGPGFPYGTLAVNIVGSLFMGLIIGYLARSGIASQTLKLGLTTGFLGGFTTFSAFSLETIMLHERGDIGLAVVYVVASVVFALTALMAGLWLSRTVL